MNSYTTLYIGSAFLGVSLDVLLPLRAYAQHYGARVVHLGPLATDEEIKMYRLRTKKLATWRKQLDELAGSTSLTPQDEAQLVNAAYEELVDMGKDNPYLVDWETLTDEELTSKDVTRLTRMLIAKVNEERIRRELHLLLDGQSQRIRTLNTVFGDVGYVFSDNQVMAPETVRAIVPLYLGTEVHGRHINALSMPANGPKVAHAPITPRTIATLAWSGKSAVMPHPIPMSDSRASEGLNNARNYFTTGMLYMPEEPTSTLDLHKGRHMPGAVVCVYGEDGSFFANNLIVDGLTGAPFIAEDGVVFTAKGVSYAPTSDIALTLADLHGPYYHWGVINGAIFAAKHTGAETIVLNGDVLDMESENRHAAGMPGLTEGKRLKNDLSSGKLLTSRLEQETDAKDLIWVLGNHEGWLSLAVEKHPSLKGLLDWETVAREWFPKWRFIFRKAGGNEIFRFGNLSYRHGDEESLQAAIEALGNTINGHWHIYFRIGQSGKQGPACTLGPKYVGNNLTAWQSQFTVQTKVRGLTQTSYKTTLHNDEDKTSRFVFRNKIITVDWSV